MMKSEGKQSKIASAKYALIKAAFLNWTQKTTAHGFLGIFDSGNHIIIRIIWILSVLASIAYCLVLMIQSIVSFFDYETSSLINIYRVDSNLEFPQIIICNWSKFATLAGAAFVLEQTRSEYGANVSSFADLTSDQRIGYNIFLNRLFSQTLSSSFNETLRDSFSYSFDEMVLDCTFNLIPCREDEWESFYSSKYGQCYKWNTGWNETSNQSISAKTQSKANEGLSLKLYVGAPQTDPKNLFWMSDEANGIYLAILNQSWIFYPEEVYNIKPGTWTDIALSRTFVENMPSPYSGCQDIDSFSSTIVTQMKAQRLGYRQKDCLDLCDQAYIINACGCYDFTRENIYNVEPCINTTQQACLIGDVLPYLNNVVHAPGCLDNCPVECKTLTYEISQSQATFPSRSYASYMMTQDLLIQNFKKDNVTLNYENLAQSVVALNIFYDDLQYTTITTSPVVTIVGLVSNLGGLIGLFLGMSLLSLIELIELGIKIVFIVFQKLQLEDVKRLENRSQTLVSDPTGPSDISN